jgi:hypothetical protein
MCKAELQFTIVNSIWQSKPIQKNAQIEYVFTITRYSTSTYGLEMTKLFNAKPVMGYYLGFTMSFNASKHVAEAIAEAILS